MTTPISHHHNHFDIYDTINGFTPPPSLTNLTLPRSNPTRPDPSITVALEQEVERLRDSAVTQTQRLLDAVSKAERAEREAQEALSVQVEAAAVAEAAAVRVAADAREEDMTRVRQEMEAALAEVCVHVHVFVL